MNSSRSRRVTTRTGWRALVAAGLGGWLALSSAGAGGADAAVTQTRDLTVPGTVRLVGSAANPIGNTVALLGDVNGDGIGDLATAGAPDPNVSGAATVVVVFGRRAGGRRVVDPLPRGAGFTIRGVVADLQTRPFGPSVAAAGDVNGDGLADILVGSSGWRPDGGSAVGRAFVVLGSRAPTDLQVGAIPAGRGYAIVAPTNYQDFGYQVSGVGDVNRDGLADLAVAGTGTGTVFEVHVLYGRRLSRDLDLGAWVPSMGWRVSGHVQAPDGWNTISLGNALAGLGDINGDGVSDLAIGAPSDRRGLDFASPGATYIVYGGRSTDLSTADLGCPACRGNGIRVTGGFDDAGGFSWELGAHLTGPGDVNGDGFRDLLVGTDQGLAGAFVLFGGRNRDAAIDLTRPFPGFAIRSASTGFGDPCCHVGDVVSPAGDLNSDGKADLLLANPADSPTVAGVRRDLTGQVYVVYGRTARTTVDVDVLPATAGYRIVGGVFGDGFGTGTAIDGGKDVTGDGRPDLAIGSALLPGDVANVAGVDVLAGP